MKNKLYIKIPGGYLIIEAKGTESDYPGVYIGMSRNGVTYNQDDMVACVEYDTGSGELKTECYTKGQEEPTHIIAWNDGRDVL